MKGNPLYLEEIPYPRSSRICNKPHWLDLHVEISHVLRWDQGRLSALTCSLSSWHSCRSRSLAWQEISEGLWEGTCTKPAAQKRWNRHNEGWANGLVATVSLLTCRQATLPREKGDNGSCRPPFRPFAGYLQTNLGHDQMNLRLVA